MVRVSSAACDITPKEACYLGGYAMRTQKSKGVLSPLNCSVLALEIDNTGMIFCSIDLLMVPGELAGSIKQKINAKYNIEPSNITIAAIHTHAAPEVRSARLPDSNDNEGFWERYSAELEQNILNTVDKCFKHGLKEVTASYSKVNINGFYGNRNGIDKPEDNDIVTIKLEDAAGNVLGAAVNISCHPTVLGAENLMVSSDLLGYIAKAVKDRYGVLPVIMQGAAGDMSNRHYRKGHDSAELERTGSGIVKQMFEGESFTALNLKAPEIEEYVYETQYEIDSEALENLRLKTLAEAENAKGYDERKILLSGVAALEMKLKNPHISVNFKAYIIRMGDLEIIKHSGEMFSRFGRQIKAESRAKLPVIWGYADDYSGYMTNMEEYGITYESMMSPLPKGAAEKITQDLCKLVSGN